MIDWPAISTETSSAACTAGGLQADGRAAALGKNADLVSQIETALPPPSTVKAWRLRSYGREILNKAGVSKRLRWCGSRISRNADGVGVYARPDRAYGRVNGVCVCGQSLACPVCAPRIAAFRAAEVAECFKKATAAGYEARLATFTTPHELGSSLGREIDCFSTAWRIFQTGRKGAERRQFSLGNHVGRECTYGEKHGWHYHHHQLRYDEPGTFCEHRARAQWLAALDAVGRKTPASVARAFDVGVVGTEAGAAYVAKLATAVEAQARAVGLEVSAGAVKGRNLATLLTAASVGDERAGRIWLDGVKCIVERKVSSVRWSRGLRAKTGLEADKSDEQIALEEVLSTDVFLGALTPMQWRGVLMHRAEFALCCAANQGLDSVNSFLAGLDLGQLNDDARPAVMVPLEAETCYTGFRPVTK
jgi:hypothetical protein